MKDVLDPFDHDIYLQLASGVTAVNILHGSANAIGGQSITCKWRLGEPPDALVMGNAPEGIKFALGENPKQSNWGDEHQSRYPQSRMGVIELIRGAFVSARNYETLRAAGKNPKPDLVLDALVEVLAGKRLVHCHSYRQDEILALIRAADEIGFKVNVFQHVLEGYKVAKAMAEHGAAASTFADWWAYKVEVEDAIPFNASLMDEAGVNVSINSDSDDLARRLNTEAAKSIRYGGMTEEKALDMITKNPARQLGILDFTGTLTPGKDGDFVVWSGHPLTQEARVLETWIDGKRYFQRSQESSRVSALDKERRTYLAALKSEEKK
jgi:imidazolonepropionase-like amidohydrolase